MGNKCDLDDMREVSFAEGKQLAQQWGCAFMETSAKERVSNVSSLEIGFFCSYLVLVTTIFIDTK